MGGNSKDSFFFSISGFCTVRVEHWIEDVCYCTELSTSQQEDAGGGGEQLLWTSSPQHHHSNVCDFPYLQVLFIHHPITPSPSQHVIIIWLLLPPLLSSSSSLFYVRMLDVHDGLKNIFLEGEERREEGKQVFFFYLRNNEDAQKCVSSWVYHMYYYVRSTVHLRNGNTHTHTKGNFAIAKVATLHFL